MELGRCQRMVVRGGTVAVFVGNQCSILCAASFWCLIVPQMSTVSPTNPRNNQDTTYVQDTTTSDPVSFSVIYQHASLHRNPSNPATTLSPTASLPTRSTFHRPSRSPDQSTPSKRWRISTSTTALLPASEDPQDGKRTAGSTTPASVPPSAL
jgi:hypothetical protein